MATRKTREEAKEVWDMFHKNYPQLHFTIVVDKDGDQIHQIHILQTLKCHVCGSEITTHAIGQHDGECEDCRTKAAHETNARTKQLKAQQYASERAHQNHSDLFGDE